MSFQAVPITGPGTFSLDFPSFQVPWLFHWFQISEIHWSINCSALGLVGFIQSLIAITIIGCLCLPASGIERFYIALAGFLSFFGQWLLTLAALFESAANIGLLKKAFDVVFAFIFQMALFRVSIISSTLLALAQ